MKAKTIILIILSSIMFNNCGSIKNVKISDFYIKDAYYQSWVLNENEKGTDLYLILSSVNPAIKFQTIIFRGMELPVNYTLQNEVMILKAVFTLGLSKLEDEKKYSAEKNQLIYLKGNAKKTLLLKKIRRKKTRFY